MPTRRESEILTAVYELCDGTSSCLVSPSEILAVTTRGKKFGYSGLDDALNSLKSSGYLDIYISERKGERTYAITLRECALAFGRERRGRRLEFVRKIALAFVGAAATFVFGLILKAIFRQ